MHGDGGVALATSVDFAAPVPRAATWVSTKVSIKLVSGRRLSRTARFRASSRKVASKGAGVLHFFTPRTRHIWHTVSCNDTGVVVIDCSVAFFDLVTDIADIVG